MTERQRSNREILAVKALLDAVDVIDRHNLPVIVPANLHELVATPAGLALVDSAGRLLSEIATTDQLIRQLRSTVSDRVGGADLNAPDLGWLTSIAALYERTRIERDAAASAYRVLMRSIGWSFPGATVEP